MPRAAFRILDDTFDVRPRHAYGKLGYRVEVLLLQEVAETHAQHLPKLDRIWKSDPDDPVEASRAQKRRVTTRQVVAGADHHHALASRNAVDFGQEAVHDFDDVVTMGMGDAGPVGERINFVDEDDRRLCAGRLDILTHRPEQMPEMGVPAGLPFRQRTRDQIEAGLFREDLRE